VEDLNGLELVDFRGGFPIWLVIPDPFDQIFKTFVSGTGIENFFNMVLRTFLGLDKGRRRDDLAGQWVIMAGFKVGYVLDWVDAEPGW